MDMEGVQFVGTVGTIVLVTSGLWGVFVKAGRPGWYALIPIYNMVTLCRVSGVTGWLVIAFMIPLVNLIALIYVANKLSKAFGKGLGYTLGIAFLGIAFLPVLGFGPAKYIGPPSAA